MGKEAGNGPGNGESLSQKNILTDLFRAAEKSFRTKGGNRHSFVRTFFPFREVSVSCCIISHPLVE
ncbi:MAG: hypothetical protein C6P37_16575 [Caldibacillus debilis]|uniref:Uncharacterized protein n=1 Tax=Caldibacillus debilis TaxID=301148 RepID=A0A3E0JUT4_9BACI|nr:MAG: hypothetical protein C6P37_16575 [Caldibacillus debilis]REJ28213.1 MAG: hypothetical protein C6W56_08570 [Caldibacillus debilis]